MYGFVLLRFANVFAATSYDYEKNDVVDDDLIEPVSIPCNQVTNLVDKRIVNDDESFCMNPDVKKLDKFTDDTKSLNSLRDLFVSLDCLDGTKDIEEKIKIDELPIAEGASSNTLNKQTDVSLDERLSKYEDINQLNQVSGFFNKQLIEKPCLKKDELEMINNSFGERSLAQIIERQRIEMELKEEIKKHMHDYFADFKPDLLFVPPTGEDDEDGELEKNLAMLENCAEKLNEILETERQYEEAERHYLEEEKQRKQLPTGSKLSCLNENKEMQKESKSSNFEDLSDKKNNKEEVEENKDSSIEYK
ncbi:hypothetical protein COBT_000714 [Conglomerata obtusa]